MNKLKLILLIIFLNIFTISHVYSNNDQLDIVSHDLLLIENWEIYKNFIDKFIKKSQNNLEKFEKLEWRLAIIQWKLKNKNDKNSIILQKIINYLDIKVEWTLLKIRNNISKEILSESDQIKEINVNSEQNIDANDNIKIYPWFVEQYNENNKVILGWEEVYIYKQSYSTLYEASEVWKIIFYITWSNVDDIKNTIETASLFLEWTEIDSVSSSKIDIISSTEAKITFNNLENFIITQNIRQVRLKIKTYNIWYQKIWKTIKDLYVSKVWFDDIMWLSSWNKLDTYFVTKPWETFSILPWVLKVKVDKNLSSNIPEINITALFWNNSIDVDNSSPIVQLSKLRFSTLWSSSIWWVNFTLYNSDRSWDKIVWSILWNTLEFDTTGMLYTNRTISNSLKWEKFKIAIDGTNSDTIIVLNLEKTWIDYDVLWITQSNDLQIKLEEELQLWTKSY